MKLKCEVKDCHMSTFSHFPYRDMYVCRFHCDVFLDNPEFMEDKIMWKGKII